MSAAQGQADQPNLEELNSIVRAAKSGDIGALENLVGHIYQRVYRLAVRMTARPPDAEDATQEILIRVVTRLGSYRGEAAFMTWVHRIAVNHLLDRKRTSSELLGLTFESYAADLIDGLSTGPSDSPDARLLEHEVQLACTHAMLLCLDRVHRLAYILGEIFELPSDAAAYVCDVDPATYRKRLSRARLRVRQFLNANCGLVSDEAMCRCAKRVDVAVATGRIQRERLEFTRGVEQATEDIRRLHDASNLLRSLPAPITPAQGRERILALLRTTSVADPVEST